MMSENLSKQDLLEKANEALKHGLYDVVAVYYDQAIILDLKDPVLWCMRGDNLRNLKRYDDAVTSYKKALELDVDNPGILAVLGFTFAEYCNLSKEAIECYEKALHLAPDVDVYMQSLINLYTEVENWERVNHWCDKLIALNKNDADAWNAKSEALFRLGKEKESQECLSQYRLLSGKQKLMESIWKKREDYDESTL